MADLENADSFSMMLRNCLWFLPMLLSVFLFCPSNLYLTCHTTIMTRVDLPYVGIAAAARALDGRASSSVWICGKLHRVTACRQASDEFPRVASNYVVRLHRYTPGRSPHGVEKGDVNRVHRNTIADAGRPKVSVRVSRAHRQRISFALASLPAPTPRAPQCQRLPQLLSCSLR